jgi:drug/metabolite transporter (DMT)-like permease
MADAPRLERTGPAAALLSALLFGLSAPLAKGLLAGAPPQLLAGLLYLGSGGGLLVVWLWRRGTLRRGPAGPAGAATAEVPLARADLPWLAGATLCGGVLAPLLLLLGLARTPASTTSLLLNLEGVFTAVIAWTLFREHAHRRIVAGMGLIVLGGLVMSWVGRAGWTGAAGPLAVAGACLCWGIDNNLTQRVAAGDPVQVAGLKGLVAGTVNVAIGLLLGGRLAGAFTTAGALALGFVSYGLSLVLFILALRQLGTARTGAYFSTAPFIGAAASVLLRGEPVTGGLLAGGALMALGVWLHLTERHEHFHMHEATTHSHRHVHDAHHRHEHAPGTEAEGAEPHAHEHTHGALGHAHPHYPDLHHRHGH